MDVVTFVHRQVTVVFSHAHTLPNSGCCTSFWSLSSEVPYYNGDLEVGGGRKVWLQGFVREIGPGKERAGTKFISLQTGDEKSERGAAPANGGSQAQPRRHGSAQDLPM